VGDVEQLTEMMMGLAAPAVLGIFGFLWRVNSKLHSIEQRLEGHEHRITGNSKKLAQHFDKAFTIRKTIE
tara:strand:- start:410 stop:619 length:210 start_codon:yes stop_codon:yes gene_type:complete